MRARKCERGKAAERYRRSCDAAAYRAVIAAYRLPKATQVEQDSRADAIEKALRQATSVPFEVAQRSLRLMNLAVEAISNGNIHAAADGAAGMHAARAALMTAATNIRTNVLSIRDSSWADRMRSKTECLEKEVDSHAFRKIAGIEDAIKES